jgi:hypothetical protein
MFWLVSEFRELLAVGGLWDLTACTRTADRGIVSIRAIVITVVRILLPRGPVDAGRAVCTKLATFTIAHELTLISRVTRGVNRY